MARTRSALTVGGLLWLIVALAPGLAVARRLPWFLARDTTDEISFRLEVGPHSTSHTSRNIPTYAVAFTTAGVPLVRRPSFVLTHLPYYAGPCLLGLSVVSTATAIRRCRRRCRPARAPGPAAGLAAMTAVLVESARGRPGLDLAGWVVPAGPGSTGVIFPLHWLDLPGVAALMVATCWATLALSGRWRPARDAAERLGRAVGWAWIAMVASAFAGRWLFAYNL